MTGVILCGGASSRMGQDKGLLPLGNATWAQHAAEKMQALSLSFVVSVGGHHRASYLQYFSEDKLVLDQDLPLGGPLRGILSVHHSMPHEDLLVLAVDLPKMPLAALKELIAESKSGARAVAYRNEDQLEPLCAFYSAAGLSYIRTCLEEGTLVPASMQHVLHLMQARILLLPATWQDGFLNFNTPTDLNR